MKTVVLGASTNTRRYSNIATGELIIKGFKVIPVGVREGNIHGIAIQKTYPLDEDVHTIAMYLSPKNQESHFEFIKQNPPIRVIFNPGSYNPKLESVLKNLGVEVVQSCVLIMLARGVY